jgi:DNA-3-methyladenine glycosylase II
MPPVLTRETLADAVLSLAAKDRGLAQLHAAHGTPPLWARRPGFITLIRIILEQQVSLASADATWRRLRDGLSPVTPQAVLAADVTRLRSLGITRQKATYCLNVAEAIHSGRLDLRELGKSDDETVFRSLVIIKGIGPWTAEVYLLMALRRPDVWPAGDIALAAAVQHLKGLRERPSPAKLADIAKDWRPYRAAAARMLWQDYLHRQRRVGKGAEADGAKNHS